MKEPFQSKLPLRFPTVFFARYQVWCMTPLEIDEMLENGWFRNDLHVYTSLGRFVNNEWKPCLMLRIPLKGFKWKKRLRKLYKRNLEIFEVKVQPFEPRAEIEVLWQKFKSEIHNWEHVPDLAHHLLRGKHPSSFNTWEVSVYKDGQLAAFSIFDKGENSICSLEAAYDVGFRKYSLGIFTMLAEIAFCLDLGIGYYYPGFYAKGASMFDYKLRPGDVEFFRPKEGGWLSWAKRSEEDWLLEEVFCKLKEARNCLLRYGFDSSVKVFNITNFPGIVPSVSDYNFLTVGEGLTNITPSVFIRIAWDPLKKSFLIFSKENQKQNSLNTKLNNDKMLTIGKPYYFDSMHRNIIEVEDRIKKILANYR